ncbi:MAG: cadherin domain-containing protein, partial [Planctomycetaceae bacterium]|nr:cadherin domain-containing protein [Planctomycetaceae bacterium]
AVNDQGNTGSGGALTASDTATINITALNDAPTATITPTTYSVNEQATLTLHGTGLSIADADGLSGTLQVTLSVGTGTLTVAAGTTGVTVSGSGSSSVSLTGTIAQINDLLAGNNAGTIDYVLNSDTPAASTVLTLAVNDQGNTGSGGALTANDTATINITALNDAPTATITPTTYSVNEQATLTLHGTGLSIADLDAASSTVRATLSVVSGTISAAAGSTGVTVSGSGTNTVTLTGTLTQINNLLAGNLSSTLTYTLNSNTPPGSDALTLTANDQGNTGSGGALTASDTATINITALNDAPTATITPTTYAVNEQATLTLHGTGLSIADADAVSGTMSVTLSVGEGTLSVAAGSTGATVSNSGTANVTITGTVTQINDLLAGNLSGTVTYTDNTDTPSASTTLTLAVNDQGNTGSGGALTATDTATINITALNDAPIATITPTSYSINEQTTLTLHGTGLSIADADGLSGTLRITLSVGEGTITVAAGTTGATVTNSGTSSVTITGTITQLNDLLAGNNSASVTYFNSLNNPSASTTLTLAVNDQGNTGAGGALIANDTATITINSDNDEPITGNATASVSEDTASTSITLTATDSDGTVTHFQLTSLPSVGTLYLDAGLTNAVSTGTNYAATGQALTLYFAPPAQWNGSATFQFMGLDNLGLADSTPATGTITYSAVNDAPVTNTNSVTLAGVNEDTVSPPGATVSALFGSAFDDSADQVSGGSSANNLAGIAITANTAVSATQGNWQYYNGSSWVNISTSVATNSALVLNASTQIRFLANADYNGTPGTLTVRLIDDSSGAVTTGTSVNVTTSGGTTRYSNLANAITLDTSIAAINDAPTATITPTTYTVSEQVTLNLHGTGLTIGDVDAASGTMSVTLSVGEGTLNVAAGATGATVVNSGTSTVTLTGTVTQINNLLAGASGATVTYVDSTDTPSASTVLTLAVNDQGNSGSGGALTASDTATINLTAVNDAPTAVITPTTYSINEQTTLALHGTGLTIADVDAGSALMRVTLSVGTGTLTVAAGATGATVSGSGTSTVTLNGTATQLNDLLAGNNGGTIDYLNSSDAPSASTTLTMTVNDLGNTGTGGALTATDTATINITALNDAPTAAITPASYTVNEQTTLTLDGTGLSIADVDAGSAIVTATLSVGEGTLTASAGSTGATVSGSGTNTLVLTGTVTQINNLLNGSGPAFVSYIDNTNAPSASTTLTLTVNDQGNSGAGGALLGSDTATIFINNVNDAPVISNATFTIAEDSATAANVGSVPVTDPDAGDSHTYSITAGNTGGAFAVDNSGQITVANAAALNYESIPSYTLTIRVQDAAGAFDTATVTVNLTDVNEFAVGPVTDNNVATNQVNENAANGTTVGLTARAIDNDPTDTVTYTLDDSAGGKFAVNVNTGVVTVAGALNAETAQIHTIIVRATSSDGTFSTQSFTINVLDLNEVPIGPVTDSDSATNEVAENSAIGTVVGVTGLATDGDVTATVTYTLTNSAGGRFAIDANTGVVTVNGAIDAESASSYTITVRALSSDGSNTSQSFVINILDVNESPVSAISDTNAGTNQVSEAAAIGATVGLTAFADDTDVTDTVSYSLDDDAGGLFTIDANTGVVTVAAGLDAETATSHTIIVRATSSDTSSSTRSFTINILDVNEVPLGPLSDANGAVNEVAENAANGTVVGITALAVDGDVTATVTYSLTNSAGGRFAINASTGVVTVVGALDAEASTSYTITVLATSSDTSTGTQSFTINLLDVNEFPTTAISDTNVATNQVAENVAIGTTVGITAQASDGDVTDTIGYSLDDDAGGLFTIDANTGVVTVAGAIDAETATSLTIIVRATSSDTSFTVRSFSINILDVNEFATTPVIDSDSAVDEVTENSAIGTVVGVTGLASDGDVTDTIAYSLDDDAGGLFTIDANTGVITVAGAIDYETAHSYTVIVRATSTDTSFATQSFTINVLDVNDNPPTLDLDGDDSSGATGLDFVTTFTEDAGAVLIGDFDLTINDPDSPIINSVVITITNRLDGAAELLAADTTGTSITAAYVNGVLTLSGADSLAHYQQVLQTVSYVNLSDDANLTDRVITFISSDGTLTGPTATATIHLVGMADAPTLTTPGLVNAVEDTPLVLSTATTGTAFLADVDSATLEMTISVLSGNVTLATTAGLTFLTGDGLHDTTLTFTGTQAALNAALEGIQFTPDTDFNGLASVTWTVRDPDNLTATGTTSVDVSAVNDAPVITGVTTVQTDEDTPVVFGAAHGNAFQVVDVDAGIVSVTLSAGNGALTLASVQGLTFVVGDGLADDTLTFTGSVSDVNTALDGLQFTPAADYHGAATIQVNVDDQGNTGTGGVLSDSLTTLLQINSVNDAPVGVDDRIETRNIDTIVISTVGFLLNDTDVDGDTLTATLLTRPTHGTLVESGGGAWLYVPDVTFFGDDTFTYITSDGQTTSQPITVTIAISIAGGPNSGGGASNAAAVSGIVSGALITSASKEESTSVVNTQTTTTTVLPVTREVVNEAPGGPLQNNANSMPTVIEVRTLDTDSQASANFRSALIVRSETNSRASDSSIARLLSPLTTYTPFNVGTMHTMLDGLRDQVEMRWESMHVSTGSVAVTAVGLTAGYALWALRGAHLVATLLTTMPAWWSIDPLPILTATQAMKMRDDDHEETLADIAGGAKKAKSAK